VTGIAPGVVKLLGEVTVMLVSLQLVMLAYVLSIVTLAAKLVAPKPEPLMVNGEDCARTPDDGERLVMAIDADRTTALRFPEIRAHDRDPS
jgi:hypothetical protein